VGPLTILSTALVLASAGAGGWAFVRSRRRAPRAESAAAPIVIFRPCAGREPSLARTLASAPRARGPVRVVFAVESERDPAAPIAEAAAIELERRGVRAKVVVTRARGPNKKADQLARAMAADAPVEEVIVVADSDVDLSQASLDALAAPVLAGAAAAYAPPVELEPRTPADRASAAVLDASLHAFAVLGAIDPGGLVGKLVALDRRKLEDVGGFGALTAHLGEDMELSRRLRARGWEVALAETVAASLAHGRDARAVVERYARWITVIRAQRPHLLPSYPLLFAQLPLLFVLAAAGAVGEGPTALGPLAFALVVRAAVAAFARARSGRSTRAGLLGAVLLAEALLTAAFARAITQRAVTWRGTPLRATRRGLELAREASS